jgi:hypothetical protein
MPFTFTPPTYLAAQQGSGILFSRYKIPRGLSVIKRGSSYETTETPSVDVWLEADMVYQGGHIYEVTAEEAALLVAAGYDVTES